jgi:hypothetical protein
MSANKDNPEIIKALLVILEDAGFVYRTKIKIEKDIEGKPIHRKL